MNSPNTTTGRRHTMAERFPDPKQSRDAPRKVRPYTGEERKVLNSGDRRRQILARIAIDRERYTEAMIDSPDMHPHFTRLISIGIRSEVAWEEHFAQYPGDGGLVPGTEGPANVCPPTETSTANHIDTSA